MQYDVLAIGDTAIDAFIRLKDARVNCDIHDQHCMICMRFGDKIPFDFDIVVPGVGNSANAAVACGRLGLKSALHTYVGDDENGQHCIDAFTKNNVAVEFVEKESGKHTNYHYVLWYESERTILIKHEVYTYSMPKKLEPPQWIYLSSMADNSLPYHQQIAAYLIANPSVKLAFQPGTFQMKLGAEALRDIYAHTEILFCNKEEAQTILKSKEDGIQNLLDGIRSIGPKIAVITDGRAGLYAADQSAGWHIPMYPDPKPPLERTGAGDATASTCVAYLALGLPLSEALMRGMINSMSVVQEVGAQKGLLTKEEIDTWYAKRPAEFSPVPLVLSPIPELAVS
jgi:ribokinase